MKRINFDAFDRVVVSVQSGAKRTKLHTFISPPVARFPESSTWALATPLSHKQSVVFDNEARRLERLAEAHPELAALADGMRPTLRREAGGLVYGEQLADKRIDLGEGVTPQGRTLAVVLQALRGGGRREVDLRDLKVVFSQLGGRITALDSLDDEQRRHAAPALYAEILRRCTTL